MRPFSMSLYIYRRRQGHYPSYPIRAEECIEDALNIILFYPAHPRADKLPNFIDVWYK